MDIFKSTDLHPYRLNDIKAYSLWDEMMLYSPASGAAFSLNSSAKAIWELCNGRHTIDEICQELGQRFDCSGAELLSDVETVVSQLRRLGLLEFRETSHPTSV